MLWHISRANFDVSATIVFPIHKMVKQSSIKNPQKMPVDKMIINTQLYSWSCTSTKQPRAKGKGELEKAKKSEYLHE